MGTLRQDLYTFFKYLAEFFWEWEIFQIKLVEKIKTHFMYNNGFPKILPFVR